MQCGPDRDQSRQIHLTIKPISLEVPLSKPRGILRPAGKRGEMLDIHLDLLNFAGHRKLHSLLCCHNNPSSGMEGLIIRKDAFQSLMTETLQLALLSRKGRQVMVGAVGHQLCQALLGNLRRLQAISQNGMHKGTLS